MFTKIEQNKTFLEILRQIKGQLHSGVLKAGDKLPGERDLSEQMGVSRAAVREAIRALEILGIVRCVQGSGNYLAQDLRDCMVEPMSLMFALGGGDVVRVQELRRALEVETASLAARNCTPREAERLREICHRLDTETDERIRAELDRTLHYTIADLAGNPMIISILGATSNLIESIITNIRVSIINDPDEIGAIDSQHRDIVAAIAAEDAAGAASAMALHMNRIMEYVVKSLH